MIGAIQRHSQGHQSQGACGRAAAAQALRRAHQSETPAPKLAFVKAVAGALLATDAWLDVVDAG